MSEYQQALDCLKQTIQSSNKQINYTVQQAISTIQKLIDITSYQEISSTSSIAPYQKGYSKAETRYKKQMKELQEYYQNRIIPNHEIYPYNFMEDVLQNIEHKRDRFDLDDESDELENPKILFSNDTILEGMAKYLTERERTVIELYYRYHKTIPEIPEILNIPYNNVLHAYHSAFCKCSQKHVIDNMRIIPYKHHKEIKQNYQQLQDMFQETYELDKAKLIDQRQMSTPLIELDLTYHAHTALHKAGFQTVGDIIEHVKNTHTLNDIRSVGKVTIRNIIDAFQEFGIDITVYLTKKLKKQ